MAERGRHYDWPSIKAMYVEGTEVEGRLQWSTLDECAAEFDANASNVRDRAAKEGWGEERTLFQRRIEAERQTKRSEEIARLGADLDVSALRIARSGMVVTGTRLLELQERARRRQAWIEQHEGNEEAALDAPPAVSASELERLARGVAVWYRLGRDAVGDVATQGLAISTPYGPIQVEAGLSDDERSHRTEAIAKVLADAGVIPGYEPRVALAAGQADADDGDQGDDAEAD